MATESLTHTPDRTARRVALWHEIDYHAEQLAGPTPGLELFSRDTLVDVAAKLVHELERRGEEQAA